MNIFNQTRLRFTPIFTTVFLSVGLASGLYAQTAPKATSPDDEGASLLALSTTGKGEAPDVPGLDKKSPDVSTSDSDGASEDSTVITKPDVQSSANQKTADEGIQIQVEKSTGKSGAANRLGSVKVYSPWPAKPMAPAPEGWKFAPAPSGLSAYKTTVKLGSGNSVDLSITPFVLVPISDGLSAIRIAEPGYDPAQQYAQKDTVGTMLQKSTVELEENEKHAAEAISRLQQLLSSLPQQQK